ncbi:hypothetical protein HDU96_009412, partial [Phlyctochytrium bullatum]
LGLGEAEQAILETTPDRCCEAFNSLFVISCSPAGEIVRLNLNQVGLTSPIPASISLLGTSLRTLDISTNPAMPGSLAPINQLPNLESFACANNTVTGPVVSNSRIAYCDYTNSSGLCLPAGQSIAECSSSLFTPLNVPACSTTSTTSTTTSASAASSTDASSISSPVTTSVFSSTAAPTTSASTTASGNASGISGSGGADTGPSNNLPIDKGLLIGLGVALGIVVIVVGACLIARLRHIRKSSYGIVSKPGSPDPENQPGTAGGPGTGTPSTGLNASAAMAAAYAYTGTNDPSKSPTSPTADPDVLFVAEMLKASGPPPRTFSVAETRKARTEEERRMDRDARKPFLDANGGREEFPVAVAHMKRAGDELVLGVGDTVVVSEVYRDGWAEGVSRRTGGPAVFPIACLGGGVPVVLARRIAGLMRQDAMAQDRRRAEAGPTGGDSPALTAVLGAPGGGGYADPATPPGSVVPRVVVSGGEALAPPPPAKKVLAPSPLRSALTLDDIQESDESDEERDPSLPRQPKKGMAAAAELPAAGEAATSEPVVEEASAASEPVPPTTAPAASA